MTITSDQLKKLSDLAYLAVDDTLINQLSSDVQAIVAFVNVLQNVNTSEVAPLLHPLDLTQPLRDDVVTEVNQLQALEKIAPRFEKNYFLVPKVIDKSK
ncbi:glutamyl/tRNA (Gln) amidotransferase subunit C (plasmid) [Legionella adelaidensis]|uniref:Aspartyl/glutamyl-tRNA(Asn/Gln) amidotransferase subunit C n=1 Tax=Legionella adelaidensis TaxID=45056 RepID=A0A0W0R4C8_9GAMM|nr:Asp-tRNA(Asn)/Glu-tRNA(Gln) amidotransferase subunit GatC [Legionella adelaidensis]KTC65917.1 glutamyl/tRNA (Gln) amidotransferase subunit C [Legionella adelaidensis]VEH85537.1 glutamyl/tRNA (Gln) amidotransferase subunit C [Legionella adelaidensis]